MHDKVHFLEGSIAVDDRGQLLFCNGFEMENIRRFYLVSNHEAKFVRAWHAHKKETKFVLVVSGAIVLAAVKIDNWDYPDRDAEVQRYVLSENKPGILVIPSGYANGFMTLTSDTKVMFFSTATLEESKKDDWRYDAYYWNPWEIKPR